MKNKGFTLTELLAMLVVLGILMLVAIPNITAIVKRQKTNKFIEDAKSMIETAKIKNAKNNVSKPGIGECIVYSLDYLNDNENIDKGPNGGEYDQFESYVIYTREDDQYKYYVKLIEINGDTNQGIEDKTIEEVKKLANSDIKAVTNLYNLQKKDDPTTAFTKANTITKCLDQVKRYYRTYCIHANNGKYYDSTGKEIDEDKYKAYCMEND